MTWAYQEPDEIPVLIIPPPEPEKWNFGILSDFVAFISTLITIVVALVILGIGWAIARWVTNFLIGIFVSAAGVVGVGGDDNKGEGQNGSREVEYVVSRHFGLKPTTVNHRWGLSQANAKPPDFPWLPKYKPSPKSKSSLTSPSSSSSSSSTSRSSGNGSSSSSKGRKPQWFDTHRNQKNQDQGTSPPKRREPGPEAESDSASLYPIFRPDGYQGIYASYSPPISISSSGRGDGRGCTGYTPAPFAATPAPSTQYHSMAPASVPYRLPRPHTGPPELVPFLRSSLTPPAPPPRAPEEEDDYYLKYYGLPRRNQNYESIKVTPPPRPGPGPSSYGNAIPFATRIPFSPPRELTALERKTLEAVELRNRNIAMWRAIDSNLSRGNQVRLPAPRPRPLGYSEWRDSIAASHLQWNLRNRNRDWEYWDRDDERPFMRNDYDYYS